jgi:hypothetical protein
MMPGAQPQMMSAGYSSQMPGYGAPRGGAMQGGYGQPGVYGGRGAGGFGGQMGGQMGPAYGGNYANYGGQMGGYGGYNRMGGGGGGGGGGMMMGGGFRGGMHAPRRRKQFVGGTLESQREWEQQNLCCFHLQGQCKFGDRCRYSHNDDGTKGCQFGLSCRVGHASRHIATPTKDAALQPPLDQSGSPHGSPHTQ